MLQKQPNNSVKTAEKFFRINGKPHGKSVLPLYIVSILIDVWNENIPPVTVTDISHILECQMLVILDRRTITNILENINTFCPNIFLKAMPVQRGKRKDVQAFSIQFKK